MRSSSLRSDAVIVTVVAVSSDVLIGLSPYSAISFSSGRFPPKVLCDSLVGDFAVVLDSPASSLDIVLACVFLLGEDDFFFVFFFFLEEDVPRSTCCAVASSIHPVGPLLPPGFFLVGVLSKSANVSPFQEDGLMTSSFLSVDDDKDENDMGAAAGIVSIIAIVLRMNRWSVGGYLFLMEGDDDNDAAVVR